LIHRHKLGVWGQRNRYFGFAFKFSSVPNEKIVDSNMEYQQSLVWKQQQLFLESQNLKVTRTAIETYISSCMQQKK